MTNKPAPPGPSAATAARSATHARLSAVAGGLNILVVEDEEDIRKLVRQYFEGHGMKVREATNGEEGWREYQRQPPDVLVTDIVLPRLTGRDLIERIRKHEGAHPVTPAVCMSASFLNAKEEAAFLKNSGADAVFRKPLPLKEMLATVVELGRHHRRAADDAAAHVPPPGAARPSSVPSAAPARPPAAPPVFTPPPPTPPPVTPAPIPPVPRPVQAPRQATMVRSAAVSGTNSLESLAAMAARIFHEKLTGVLEVTSGGHLRKLIFYNGLVIGTSSTVEDERLGALLIEAGLITADHAAECQTLMHKQGVRFGYAIVMVAGIPASAVAQALEEQTLWVAMQAFSRSEGEWAFKPMTENPVLAMQLRMDPVEAVQRACLQCVGAEEARAVLLAQPPDALLLRTRAFEERALVFSALRPTASLPGQLLDDPTLSSALQRAAAVSDGMNQLLALVLSGAFFIGREGDPPPDTTRGAVVGTFGGLWRAGHLSERDIQLREMIALEWLRTGGRKAHDILEIPEHSPPDAVRAALWTLSQKFGPPALDDVDLGPAKRVLHVVRARNTEAARLMGVET